MKFHSERAYFILCFPKLQLLISAHLTSITSKYKLQCQYNFPMTENSFSTVTNLAKRLDAMIWNEFYNQPTHSTAVGKLKRPEPCMKFRRHCTYKT